MNYLLSQVNLNIFNPHSMLHPQHTLIGYKAWVIANQYQTIWVSKVIKQMARENNLNLQTEVDWKYKAAEKCKCSIWVI